MNLSAQKLVEAMDIVSNVVENNLDAMKTMDAESKDVAIAIDNIASVNAEYSASMEEVSASTIEMSAQVSEVMRAAQLLAQMSQALKGEISQFKLN